MKGKLLINIDLSERDLVEGCLNLYHSGYEYKLILLMLSLYALQNRWHFNKLDYYLKLIEEDLKDD